jgi:hypothetical protein
MLTTRELIGFYNDNKDGKAEKLRSYVCKFQSEWGVPDLQKALDKVNERGFWTPDIDVFRKYNWWQNAVSAGVGIPRDSHVWHYHPVRVLEDVSKPGKVLKKNDSGIAVQEASVRLAGFGGSLPTSIFNDQLEKCVKQFQKDFMEVPQPSGQIDELTARAIDDFGDKYSLDISALKCPCGSCSGFGNGKYPDSETNYSGSEAFHKYEFPGIHRSLLWAVRSLSFYLSKNKPLKLKIDSFSSGYRCHINNTQHSRTSTNHMGKAIDIKIAFHEGNTWKSGELEVCNIVRNLCQDKMSAKVEWDHLDGFSLEPGSGGSANAPTWVHLDVRTFNRANYLQDLFFAKDVSQMNKQKMEKLLGGFND